MRTNKTILDEAARSVRRTFIGSVAGSVGMLAVVGAAGAFGMPEKLTTQALSLAIAKFGMTVPHEGGARQPERKTALVTVAQNMPSTSVSDVTPLAMPKRVAAKPQSGGSSEVVRAVPPEPVIVETAPATEASAPVAAASAAPAPVVAAPAPTTPTAANVVPFAAPSAEAASAFALALPQPSDAELVPMVPVIEPRREPEPAQTASIAPDKASEAVPQSVTHAAPQISAPMLFEAPQASDVRKLIELPKTEEVVATPTPKPVQAQPQPQSQPQVPMPVTVALPLPKPPLTPAQRLDLQGKEYDKAEKCLAQAIYFEARNEPARGQQAVAQVVLNRVFSSYYPKDVCSVVGATAMMHRPGGRALSRSRSSRNVALPLNAPLAMAIAMA